MNRNKLKNILSKRVLILDGAMGTELIRKGFDKFPPEVYLPRNQKAILEIQRDYVNAGCDILLTATLGANPLKLKTIGLEDKMEEINERAVDTARAAATSRVLLAGDLGPTGEMFPPSGSLNFARVYECYSKEVKVLKKKGVGLFILETFSDIRELKAALLAVRDNAPDTFIVANLTFDKDGRTLIGTDPTGFALSFEDMDVDALGINCSLGPEGILPIFQELSRMTTKLLSIKPNAGIPEIVNGKTVYRMGPEEFVKYGEDFFELGANIIGGCCGTGPEHINLLVKRLGKRKPNKREKEILKGISALTKNVIFVQDSPPVVIGERINPTGKKKMTEEIEKGTMQTILTEAKRQSKAGASVLDLNFGMESGIREDWTRNLVTELLISPGLPLSLDLRSEYLIEAALQEYGGRVLLNSITLEDMDKKVKLLKRYGGMVVFLPIDKNGIAENAKKRLTMAKKAIRLLKEMGFEKKRILFDPVVMSLATGYDPSITIEALKLYKSLGLLTVLGLSNISYGLPYRANINNYFLNLCTNIGLDAVIMNPLEKEISPELDLSPVFSGEKNVVEFLKEIKVKEKERVIQKEEKEEDDVLNAVIAGEKEKTLSLVKELLKEMDYEEVIEEVLRPALEEVGKRYEKREIFLPQLIMAAESAQTAFVFIEASFQKKKTGKGKVVIATVRGDIHDIGKNIVAMMLKNAGFDVTDLGKDVPTEVIVKSAKETGASVIALSALMTTTALKMKEVIGRLKEEKVPSKVIIGGACITNKFASDIGADAYAKDASQATKEVKKLMKKNNC